MDKDNPFQRLAFIPPEVLGRLVTGSFITVRTDRRTDRDAAAANPSFKSAQTSRSPSTDRRKMSSVRALKLKALLKVDPLVFRDRKHYLVSLAKALNDPSKKLLMVKGEEGVGKTSLVKALIDLIDSSSQFTPAPGYASPVSPETSACPEVVWVESGKETTENTLIQALHFQLATLQQILWNQRGKISLEQVSKTILTETLESLVHLPLLVVLENSEHWTTPTNTIAWPGLKSVFNTLLAYPNIKLLLVGQHSPTAELDVDPSVYYLLTLPPLSPDTSLDILRPLVQERGYPILDGQHLVQAACGIPRHLQWLQQILKSFQGASFLEKIAPLSAEKPTETLFKTLLLKAFLPEALSLVSAKERFLLGLLAVSRLPLTVEILESISQNSAVFSSVIQPNEPSSVSGKTVFQAGYVLLSSLVRPCFRPERVHRALFQEMDLSQALPHEPGTAFKSAVGIVTEIELPEEIRAVILSQLNLSDQVKCHETFTAFYRLELATLPKNRKTRILDRLLRQALNSHEKALHAFNNLLPLEPSSPSSFRESALGFSDIFSSFSPEVQLEEASLLSEKAFSAASLSETLQTSYWEPVSSSVPLNTLPSNLTEDASKRFQLKNLTQKLKKQLQPLEDEHAVLDPGPSEGVPFLQNTVKQALTLSYEVQSDQETLQTRLQLYCMMGSLEKQSYRYHEAKEWLLKASELFSTVFSEEKPPQDPSLQKMIGRVYQQLGEIEHFYGHFSQAASWLHQAIKSFKRFSQPKSLAECLLSLADIQQEFADTTPQSAYQVLELYQSAGEIFKTLSEKELYLSTLLKQASVYVEIEALEHALSCLKQALKTPVAGAGQEALHESVMNVLSHTIQHAQTVFYPLAPHRIETLLGMAFRYAQKNKLVYWQSVFQCQWGDFLRGQKETAAKAPMHYQHALDIGKTELNLESIHLLETRLLQSAL